MLQRHEEHKQLSVHMIRLIVAQHNWLNWLTINLLNTYIMTAQIKLSTAEHLGQPPVYSLLTNKAKRFRTYIFIKIKMQQKFLSSAETRCGCYKMLSVLFMKHDRSQYIMTRRFPAREILIGQLNLRTPSHWLVKLPITPNGRVESSKCEGCYNRISDPLNVHFCFAPFVIL